MGRAANRATIRKRIRRPLSAAERSRHREIIADVEQSKSSLVARGRSALALHDRLQEAVLAEGEEGAPVAGHRPRVGREVGAYRHFDAGVTAVLDRLEAQGRVLSGAFLRGGTSLEWCDVEVLRTIRRRSIQH